MIYSLKHNMILIKIQKLKNLFQNIFVFGILKIFYDFSIKNHVVSKSLLKIELVKKNIQSILKKLKKRLPRN